MSSAYDRIFERLGVPWVRVRGDGGVMGGSQCLSHEFHFPANIGQDSLLLCSKYKTGVNLEVGWEEGRCPQCGGSGRLYSRAKYSSNSS